MKKCYDNDTLHLIYLGIVVVCLREFEWWNLFFFASRSWGGIVQLVNFVILLQQKCFRRFFFFLPAFLWGDNYGFDENYRYLFTLHSIKPYDYRRKVLECTCDSLMRSMLQSSLIGRCSRNFCVKVFGRFSPSIHKLTSAINKYNKAFNPLMNSMHGEFLFKSIAFQLLLVFSKAKQKLEGDEWRKTF